MPNVTYIDHLNVTARENAAALQAASNWTWELPTQTQPPLRQLVFR